jgi:hypothetical protein
MISQTLNQKPHQGGAARKIGDKTARRLERGMNKDPGWLDIDRGPALLSVSDHTMLATYRKLTIDQQEVLLTMAAEFARLNHGGGSDPEPQHPPPIIRQ